MTEPSPLKALRRAFDGTILEGATLLIRDDGYLQIGDPDVELGQPSGWRRGGINALLEEARDSRFGGLLGLERGAFVVANAVEVAPAAWRWDLLFDVAANRASTLHGLGDEPAAFPW